MFGIAIFHQQLMGERDMKKQVLVKEVMRASPAIVQPFTTVFETAHLMRDKKIGEVIVAEQGHPIGVVTERDIVKKIVCEKKNASDVSAEEVMSTPVVVVDPFCSLQDALKIMGRGNIQQLTVVENNQLVGIITQHDITQLSPALSEIDHEWSSIKEGEGEYQQGQMFSGKCEDCDVLSMNLKFVDGRLLCEECIAGLKFE
jgi:predicted transcriptional regulator